MGWGHFLKTNANSIQGTEHWVEKPERGIPVTIVAKITVPPKFGLVPAVVRQSLAGNQFDHNLPATRATIEFIPATPLEYLDRWIAANMLFGDDVRLASIIQWPEGTLSFGITQPQYEGAPAESQQIEAYFKAAGWTWIRDPSEHREPPGHTIFYNYAHEVLAIDAQPRNCHINSGILLPFDVILCHPEPELEEFLKLY